MQKILLATKAANLNIKSAEFACFLAQLTNSGLTGVFLEEKEFEETPVRKVVYGMPYVETIVAEDLPDIKQQQIQKQENIRVFKEVCTSKNVNCCLHNDRGVPVKELIKESRFADLVIVDAETSFADERETMPTHLVKEILAEAECPVIISPACCEEIKEIVFCYDGTKSSVFAMKHFSYLFPELQNTQVTIAKVNETENSEIEEKEKLTEWLKEHYNKYEFIVLHGIPEIELLDHLLHKKHVTVVMGAYGRSTVSRFVKRSIVDILSKIIIQPIFVAHN